MKKLLSVLILLTSILFLSCCGNDKENFSVSVTSSECTRDTITLNLLLSDEDKALSKSAFYYEITRTETGSLIQDGEITFEDNEYELVAYGLLSGKEYELKVTCGYQGKEKVLLTSKYSTTSKGTKDDPYVITTPSEFNSLLVEDSGSYFELGNDLDFTDVECKPLFTSLNSFTGSFDGKGYSLKNITMSHEAGHKLTYKNSYGNEVNYQYFGIFGYIGDGAVVKNVVVDNMNFTATYTSSTMYLGVIAGSCDGTIDNVKVTNSSLKATFGNYNCYAGGISGILADCATVINSKVNCNIEINSKDEIYVGGIAGKSNATSELSTNEYKGVMNVTNSETGSAYNNSYIGGIVGYNNTNISYCSVDLELTFTNTSKAYSEGSSQLIGGLVGYNNKSSIIVKGCTVKTTMLVSSLFCKEFAVGLIVGKNGATAGVPIVIASTNYVGGTTNVLVSTITNTHYGLVGLDNSSYTNISQTDAALTFKLYDAADTTSLLNTYEFDFSK